jgi:lactose/L-arabinose transport system permease protein
MRRYNNGNIGYSILRYIFLAVISFIFIFPFVWMIICATNSAVDINRGKMIFGGHLAENLRNLFTSAAGYLRAICNSTVIAIVTTVPALLISSFAGYGFEIFRSKGRDRLFNMLLVSMMIPFCALMTPLYRMFGSFNTAGLRVIGLNSPTSVILPSLSTAFLIFFFRQSTKAFPKDIIEATRIDGVNELGIFFKMYIPVMKSSYAAAAIITFMSSWNSYLWPLITLQSPEKRTVPLVLSAMGASYTPDYGMIMAGIVIATLPTAAIFFFMQKHFVAGMIGSVK